MLPGQAALLTRLYLVVGTPNAGSSNFRRLWIWKCTSDFVKRRVGPCKKIIVRGLIINSSPAMFDSATNVMITGGQFTASQGNHANVTINIGV